MTNFTIAIGDIHGCYDQMVELLAKVDEGYPERQLVFLGDYVDRGPNSKGVVQKVIDLEKSEGAIVLRGNHEDMMIDPQEQGIWLHNGGYQCLQSYGWTIETGSFPNPEDSAEFYRHLSWLTDNSRLFYQTDRHFFVHAGINPDLPLDKQKPQDLLWIRHYFLNRKQKFPKYIVHGHTPLIKPVPMILDNRINMDTSCVFGGRLTAAIFVPEQDQPVDIIQVEGYKANE